MERLSIDKKHSVFWREKTFTLYILKIKHQDSFCISIKDDGVHSVFFTGNAFSSLLCELIKYSLDLPTVARKIPCPISGVETPHGCLREMESVLNAQGEVTIPLDDRWLEYHGNPENAVWVWEKETGKVYIKAATTKAMKQRRCSYCGTILSKVEKDSTTDIKAYWRQASRRQTIRQEIRGQLPNILTEEMFIKAVEKRINVLEEETVKQSSIALLTVFVTDRKFASLWRSQCQNNNFNVGLNHNRQYTSDENYIRSRLYGVSESLLKRS